MALCARCIVCMPAWMLIFFLPDIECSNNVSQCAVGTYKNATGTCTACPGNSSSSCLSCLETRTGPQCYSCSTVLTQCSCNAGFFGPNGSSCKACAPETFKSAPGPGECRYCPPGHVSNANNANCTATKLVVGGDKDDHKEDPVVVECSHASSVLALWGIFSFAGLAWLAYCSNCTFAPVSRTCCHQVHHTHNEAQFDTRLGYIHSQAPVQQQLNQQMLPVQQTIPARPQQAPRQAGPSGRPSQAPPVETFSPSLPTGWEMKKDQTGRSFYINHTTKTSQWEPPVQKQQNAQTQAPVQQQQNVDDLPPEWKTGKDQTGNQYYYNKELNVTQWSHPTQLSGGYGMPVLGLSFGVQTPDAPESISRDIQRTSMSWKEMQEKYIDRHPKAWASWNLFEELVLERLVFIIPVLVQVSNAADQNNDKSITVAVSNPYLLLLYCFDLLILIWAFSYKRYIPGCMYNHVHVLMTGIKFKPAFVSRKSPKNFSGKKKLIVGLGAISMLVQTVATISEAWCIFDPTSSDKKTPTDFVWILMKLFGIVSLMLNGWKPLVAFVATTVFIVFSAWAYIR